MHPGLQRLLIQLKATREAAGFTAVEVERELVLGPGWVAAFEDGDVEPSFGTLAALTDLYGTNLSEFFSTFDIGDVSMVLDRHLSAVQVGNDVRLLFPMGPHDAAVMIENATIDQFNTILLALRDQLATGESSLAVRECFLTAVKLWPDANPSDLWYFLTSHAYQDSFNHPAHDARKDWAQSWKRAGGWALENIFVEHYNPYLRDFDLWLEMPERQRKVSLLKTMGVWGADGAEKSDVIAMGKTIDGKEEPFGVVHVKASFAERRTDDVPLSQQLISRGYASPLVTMDCKAKPSPIPYNGGELGLPQGGNAVVSSKRLDIERDRKFDACFSYNANTAPTQAGSAAARIYLCTFADPNDLFSQYLVRRWRDMQGL